MEDDIFNGYADITELQEARERERLGFVRRSPEVVAPEGTVMAEEVPSEVRDPLSPSMQDVAIPEDDSIESYITRLGQSWYNLSQSGVAEGVGAFGELESLGRGIFQLVTNLAGEPAAEAWKRGVSQETVLPKVEEMRSNLESVGIEPVGDFSPEDLKAQKELGGWMGLPGAGALAWKGAKTLRLNQKTKKASSDLLSLAQSIKGKSADQTIDSIKGNLVKTLAGEGPWVRVCHKDACEAFMERGIKSGDKFIILGSKDSPNTAVHTIAVDKKNNIVGDSILGKFDGKKWNPTDKTPKEKQGWSLDVLEEVDAVAAQQAARNFSEVAE